jgi:hypothetical protein
MLYLLSCLFLFLFLRALPAFLAYLTLSIISALASPLLSAASSLLSVAYCLLSAVQPCTSPILIPVWTGGMQGCVNCPMSALSVVCFS